MWLAFAMEMTPSCHHVTEARMLCTAFNMTGILALFQSSSQAAAAFRKVKALGPDLILDLRKANFANKSLEEAIMEKILSSIKQSRPACFRVVCPRFNARSSWFDTNVASYRQQMQLLHEQQQQRKRQKLMVSWISTKQLHRSSLSVCLLASHSCCSFRRSLLEELATLATLATSLLLLEHQGMGFSGEPCQCCLPMFHSMEPLKQPQGIQVE